MRKELIIIVLSVALVAFVAYFSISQTGRIIQEDVLIDGFQKTSYNTYGINIVDNSYSMPEVRIEKGDRIIWKNYDQVKHTITSEEGNELNSGSLESGETYSHFFESVGEFNYYCEFHPWMRGKIIVE